MSWHFYFGYGALGASLFRIAWGFMGPDTARFSSFLRGPKAIVKHLQTFTRAPAERGHNPLGALAVVALLTLTLIQASTGLFSSDEIEWYGPLSERVEVETMQAASSWHRLLEPWLLLMIALHILAVMSYLLIRRENLITPMLSGKKAGVSPPIKPRPFWLSWTLALMVAAAIASLLYFYPTPETLSLSY